MAPNADFFTFENFKAIKEIDPEFLSIIEDIGRNFAGNKYNNSEHESIHFGNYNRILTLVNFFFKYVAS